MRPETLLTQLFIPTAIAVHEDRSLTWLIPSSPVQVVTKEARQVITINIQIPNILNEEITSINLIKTKFQENLFFRNNISTLDNLQTEIFLSINRLKAELRDLASIHRIESDNSTIIKSSCTLKIAFKKSHLLKTLNAIKQLNLLLNNKTPTNMVQYLGTENFIAHLSAFNVCLLNLQTLVIQMHRFNSLIVKAMNYNNLNTEYLLAIANSNKTFCPTFKHNNMKTRTLLITKQTDHISNHVEVFSIIKQKIIRKLVPIAYDTLSLEKSKFYMNKNDVIESLECEPWDYGKLICKTITDYSTCVKALNSKIDNNIIESCPIVTNKDEFFFVLNQGLLLQNTNPQIEIWPENHLKNSTLPCLFRINGTIQVKLGKTSIEFELRYTNDTIITSNITVKTLNLMKYLYLTRKIKTVIINHISQILTTLMLLLVVITLTIHQIQMQCRQHITNKKAQKEIDKFLSIHEIKSKYIS